MSRDSGDRAAPDIRSSSASSVGGAAFEASTPAAETGVAPRLAVEFVDLFLRLVRHAARPVGAAPDDWLDQSTSPLGARLHTRAWRDGRLRGFKLNRRVFATRAEVARFIETNGLAQPATGDHHQAPRDTIDRDLADLGFGGGRGCGP